MERQDGAAGDFTALRAALSKRLPSHMTPAVYVGIDAWPLSPNGKIDRKALQRLGVPVAGEAGQPEPGAVVGPRSPIEEAVAGIFAAVLRLPRVGIHDDFFHLGGHSLIATQLVACGCARRSRLTCRCARCS